LELDPIREEEYQRLRRNLFASPQPDDIRAVMLVGSDHGEGVTTTCVTLASVLARAGMGDVVLIDANLRTPSLHTLFRSANGTAGLTALVTREVDAKALLQSTSIANLSIITSGPPLRSPSLLYQGALNTLITQLRQDFRYILIDCSPVFNYSDAAFLAPQVDGIVLVVRAERTKIAMATRSKEQLERVGGQILGTVVNAQKRYIPRFLELFLYGHLL
jgi:capsular exopolysaccharide synthesis family protein